MGITYYAWPLRSELDYTAALRDPCAAARALDRREPVEISTGLDKAFRYLHMYFAPDEYPNLVEQQDGDATAVDEVATRCRCVRQEQVWAPPRPGALLLRGDVLNRWSMEPWVPYYGIISPLYVRMASEDYATVDLDDLEQACDRLRDWGEYCRQQFTDFRAAIERYASEGAGLLYTIT